ncbi:hypothetical protein [Synechococcus sp. CC9902]|uniref:hypothetical protein n=1 Tax=Synechococcus sp. (strain CC9902) TaxID=316279 RepID=UPI0012EA49ED|nr:hypothetical protein [Synechococcus sp. CC9902]
MSSSLIESAPSFKVFYRTSSKFGRHPIDSVDSFLTIKTILQSFSKHEVVCICDNTSNFQSAFFSDQFPHTYITKLGNCGSFRLAVKLAMASLHPASIYYFVEDDHLHLPDQKKFLIEGLKHFDFVSLYDHPDKYFDPGYQQLRRRIVWTSMGHFAESPSTVMTFACSAETLKRASPILLDERLTGSDLKIPLDHSMFIALGEAGFSLGTALPGRSTHCEQNFLSPGIDWLTYAKQIALDCFTSSNA